MLTALALRLLSPDFICYHRALATPVVLTPARLSISSMLPSDVAILFDLASSHPLVIFDATLASSHPFYAGIKEKISTVSLHTPFIGNTTWVFRDLTFTNFTP